MNKKLLLLLFVPFLLTGCNSGQAEETDTGTYETHTIEHPKHSGEIGDFALTGPGNGFITDTGFTFTWEAATNSDYYQIEISSTLNFINDDEDEVYVRESNLAVNQYVLSFVLPKKDITYYWRVTAVNKDHKKKCSDEMRTFQYNAAKVGELPIAIEDEQDWVLHKEGSYADISIDRTDFFNNGHDSLAIVFDKEHTCQGIAKSDGWIVITKTEDRELYGTDAFYFNFYYSGHDATVLVRVLDYDGEYWHKQVQIANNSKQTILVRYDEFELRTATGSPLNNRKFDWEHIRYFEIVFERTFGDGVCLFSNIKAVRFDDYSDMFIKKMDFRITDPSTWTYENYDFTKTISEDGSELTLGYSNGLNGGYGFQNVNLYKYFVSGDALRMKVKYTGTDTGATFFFRILEEDNDRWQFKTPFTYLIKNDYKELVIPLKSFQRTDYMTGDGAKQFYFIQKLNIGLANNYSNGTLSVKDLEVIRIDDIVDSRKRVVSNDGLIEDFNDYNIYTEIYYYWEQSVVNKDEAMKLDTIHKTGGKTNTYCAEFDYKADMEQAVYQLYMDSTNVDVNKNAFSIWLKDATPKPDNPTFAYLAEEDIAAELTIQLTMESGEWYRYIIPKVGKEWNNYTILFEDFFLENGASLFDAPQPLQANKIIHMALGLKYLFYDQQGNHVPTYAIANPVYLDELRFANATETSIVELGGSIKEDTDDPSKITVETMETYENNEDIFEYWSYATELDYNSMTLGDDVSSIGGTKSMKMHYKGGNSVSYMRTTQFAKSVTAKGFSIDIKGDGVVGTIYLNLNWRSGSNLFKMRYALNGANPVWTHYEIGFELFKDVGGTNKTITSEYARDIESISFGIVNSDGTESDIYVDNLRLLKNVSYKTFTKTVIS